MENASSKIYPWFYFLEFLLDSIDLVVLKDLGGKTKISPIHNG